MKVGVPAMSKQFVREYGICGYNTRKRPITVINGFAEGWILGYRTAEVSKTITLVKAIIG